ncbi:hypothetical protein BGZ57DRAFT_1004177 [Hyaloscypha finlandica]|nr:hypothetical protein F5882DRAFT_481386 [Hyaloscypha sp. PMI_1271]KAH8778963.1 hypothetical protein BGZ57DRAFT_1004177 [Hyaloscypha finlandica]
MHFEKEMAETKALRKQQVREEKKAISKNRALVEKRALAEQKSPLEAMEIANKKARAEKRALAEKKRLAREELKKEIAEAKEIAREQKQTEIKGIAEVRSLAERRALAENKLPAEVMEIAKKTAVTQKKILAEKKKQEALAMKRKSRIQGPELPPKKSHTYLSKAISVLQEGDQDCLIWAASFSKRLSLWHQTSGDRLACRNEKDRTIAIRLKIEAIPPAKIISRRSKVVCEVRGGPGYVNGLRIQHREAHRGVVSSLEAGLDDDQGTTFGTCFSSLPGRENVYLVKGARDDRDDVGPKKVYEAISVAYKKGGRMNEDIGWPPP